MSRDFRWKKSLHSKHAFTILKFYKINDNNVTFVKLKNQTLKYTSIKKN